MVAISHNPFLNRHPFRDGEGAVSVVLGKLLREPVICGSVRQQIPVFGFVFQCGGEVGKSWGRSWPVIYIEESELPPAWHERQWPRVLQDEPEGGRRTTATQSAAPRPRSPLRRPAAWPQLRPPSCAGCAASLVRPRHSVQTA